MKGEKAPGVRELLLKHDIRLSKSRGQCFLVDKNIPEKIVRLSGLDDTCGVLEVGPGVGALTEELCKKARRVLAIELDKRLLPILGDSLEGFSNVEIMQGDVMKMDIPGVARSKMPGLDLHVCSNLPYNITTPLLTALMAPGVFKSFVVMLQREVAQRICAEPGAPEYGAFTLFACYHNLQRKILFDVPPGCFIPRPNVVSSVVFMEARPERLLGPGDEKDLFKVVRAAFSQRRKILVNALHAGYGEFLGKDCIAGIVAKCGLDGNARGEELGLEDFIALSAAINNELRVTANG